MKTIMLNIEPTITPLMFSSGNRQLMGVCYAPSPPSIQDVSVLLCNQVGPDYAEYFKTSRILLNMLVAGGFNCLRFDYTGCGDSEGNFTEGSVSQWISDIATAKTILKDQSGCSNICICGFGFGGLLATAHAAVSVVSAIILWEPVVDGQIYCRRLRKNHRQWLHGSFVKVQRVDKRFQTMGFPATADLEKEMCRLNINDLPSCRAEKIFAVVRDGSPDQALIAAYCARCGKSFHSCGPGQSLPLRPMQALVAWLKGLSQVE